MAESRFDEVLRWLYRLEAARGMDFKLERIALALRNLGDPQKRFRAVHIAGTNGKGSVAALVHAMLGAAGQRAGLYTSPHLVSFTERIRVGSEPISEAQVVALTEEIRAAATVRGIDLTFFELTTVMSFLHFARSGIEIAVVEVGLGGRLDATNVIDAEVAVITSIGLDHEEYLGSTIASVAREKAGIIKADQDVFVGRVPSEALAVIAEIASERSARLWRIDEDFCLTDSTPARFRGLDREIDDLQIGLPGAFQRDNAALAIAAVCAATRAQPLSDEAVRSGCGHAYWPGRLELVWQRPRVILDCAHNPDGASALIQALDGTGDGSPIHLLFAVMRDKRWQQMVRIIAPQVADATVTTVLPPRGESAERVAAEMRQYVATEIASDPISALTELIERVPPADTILVTGSLFLVGAVYPYFLQRQGRTSPFAVAAESVDRSR